MPPESESPLPSTQEAEQTPEARFNDTVMGVVKWAMEREGSGRFASFLEGEGGDCGLKVMLTTKNIIDDRVVYSEHRINFIKPDLYDITYFENNEAIDAIPDSISYVNGHVNAPYNKLLNPDRLQAEWRDSFGPDHENIVEIGLSLDSYVNIRA